MSIFAIEKRNEIQQNMLSIGIDLIKEKGLRKLTVSDVTNRTGIGKGTFYHFYDSKELYIYDVIIFSKNRIKDTFDSIVEKNGKINRDSFDCIFEKFSFSSENNFLSNISEEDMTWLLGRLPQNCKLDPLKEEDIISAILSNCEGLNENINHHVLANMIKIMSLAAENKDRLYVDSLSENLILMKEVFLDYLFQK